MICPRCRHDNPDGARQCARCGESLADPTWGETRVRPEPEADRSDRGLWGETAIGPDPSPASLEPGGLIAGRYEVIRELGRGGMGVVYLVKDLLHQDHERLVALKTIHPALVHNTEAMRRFEREVAVCQDLTHPHIVNVYDLYDAQGLRFFTMAYLPGRSLREVIEERKSRGETFSLAETAAVIDRVLEALEYAHGKGAVHRDIKPENVMIDGQWPDLESKVLDFGLAKTLSPSSFSNSHQAMGTFGYVAPEQYTPPFEVDHRADIFSVGVICYELLTGELSGGVFDMPSELVDGLPGSVDELVRRAMKKNPQDRFASAGEFRWFLNNILESERKRLEEEEVQRRKDEEERRLWEKRERERERIEAEKRRQEEAERLRREEEAGRRAEEEEKRRREEAERLRREEEARRQAEEKKKRRQAEAERRRQEEERWRLTKEQHRAEEERRLQEKMGRRRAEQDRKRKAEETHRLAEAERLKKEKERKRRVKVLVLACIGGAVGALLTLGFGALGWKVMMANWPKGAAGGAIIPGFFFSITFLCGLTFLFSGGDGGATFAAAGFAVFLGGGAFAMFGVLGTPENIKNFLLFVLRFGWIYGVIMGSAIGAALAKR